MPQANADQVKKIFQDFGMEPSPEEIMQFAGIDYIGGGTAIANYVSTKKAQMEREANDPLKKVLEAQQTFTAAQEARSQGLTKEANDLFTQLMGKLSEAPKLFGNLTPEQIDTYMAPIKAQTEGDIARRGLAGSSTEVNALTGNALKAGLDVGRELQGAQAGAIQGEIARKTGLIQGAVGAQAQGLGLQGQTAGALSEGARDDERFLSSLPLYLRSYAAQEVANWRAGQKQKKGLLGTLSDINQGINLGSNILSGGMLDRVMPTQASSAPAYGFAPQPRIAGSMGSGGGAPALSLGPEAAALL